MSSFSDQIGELHRIGVSGKGAGVGHLDTGVDPGHALFRTSDGASAVSTVVFGYRFGELRHACSGSGDRSASHGTRMASLLVGAPPVGVAPDARLYSGAVIEAGNVIARIVAGLDWLSQQDVGVVCLSLGVFTNSPVFDSLIRALTDRDVLVVAASGNHGPGRLSSPGSSPSCLTVGACDDDGRATAFSGSSATWTDRSMLKPEVLVGGVSDQVGSDFRAGTSQSCALAAGLAALLRAGFPHASAVDVRNAILASAAAPHADQANRSVMGAVQPLAAFAHLNRLPVWHSPSVSLAHERSRYVDPRLLAQVAAAQQASSDAACDALFEFTSASARSAFEHRMAGELPDAGGSGDIRLRCESVPIVAGTFATAVISELVASDQVCVASALDIDPLAQSVT